MNAAKPQFKVQGSRFKVRAALNCGGAALNWPKAVEL
jgi:hypothetical protein